MNKLTYKTTLGSSVIDPWETQFAFFWYNDQEIFHDTERDLEFKAEQLANGGVNHVITFSCTHFRWSFRDYWSLLNETLEKVVRACHKHGILVTEHHSSELSYFLGNDADLAYLKDILRVRQSSIESWPDLIKSAQGDPVLIDDIRRSEMIQIDGAVGGFRPNSYHASSMCFNNPHFRRAYFKYLESVYDTGVDGIMTDDVQWIGADPYDNACTCQYCRNLFAENTGLELPDNGQPWVRFMANPKNPLFLAWLDFRFRSIENFHVAVKDHYEGMGLRLLRPNYCSSVLNRNPSAYALDTLPELDWVFQESCYSTIIRYSWPAWAVEQAHRHALGRVRDIPPMVMFYPDRPDTTLFCWASAMSWGAKYLGTDEGNTGNETEARLRQFEYKNRRLLQNPKKIARLAFFDSKRNRELYYNYEDSTDVWTTSWIQACLLNNIPFDLLLADEIDSAASFDLIVLPDVAVLSDGEIVAFREFASNGGTVIWGGKSGSLGYNGNDRSENALSSLLGLQDIWSDAENRTVPMDQGRIVFLTSDSIKAPPLRGINQMRFDADAKVKKTKYESFSTGHRKQLKELAGFIASFIPGDKILSAAGLPEDVLATIFSSRDDSALVVHLLNASNTLENLTEEGVNHEDQIPYSPFSEKIIDIEIRLPEQFASRRLANVLAHDPNRPCPMPLDAARDFVLSRVTVKFNLDCLKEYTVIELVFE
ncbi:MAG: hypothetical protein DRP71_07045 [Verrucomicrobia bacterium]|nr:MAG: hypothetical protein DRP71_07045 [Verrucomicrobiota bacterium]